MKKQRICQGIVCVRVILVAGVLALPTMAVAQNYYDPGLLQNAIQSKPVDYQSAGVRMGGFELHTGAELAWEKNDNIFYLNDVEVSDTIIHARPWLNLNSDWNRHALNLSAFADLGFYNDYGSQDYKDWVVSLDGRIDVKRGSAFSYKASSMNLHEERSSPDGRYGVKPTEFSFSGFDVGYAHTFNRLTAAVNYNLQDADYDNNKDIEGNVIDNQDRDRSRDSWSLRLGYDYSPQSNIFVEYAANSLDYDQTFDSNGYHRSSDGYDIRGGLSWNMTGVLTGDLYLQYIKQEYDDRRFRTVSGFGIGGDLSWTPTRLTSIKLRFANAPQETTQIGTSGYYSSLYSARVQHELRRNVLLNARMSYTDNQYEYNGPNAGNLNNTEVTRMGLGMSYLFTRRLYLSGGYVYEQQDANTPEFEYKTNRFFITFGGEL